MGLSAAAGTAGPAAGSPTTGTRCSPRTGWRGTRRARRPVRLHRQPGQQPVDRGCATCSAPSRPTRTRSSARAPAAPSSSTAVRAPGRPSSPCTATAYLLYADPRVGHDRGGVLFVGPQPSPTWPTSPTCCPASARTACGPATLRDLVPEGATAGGRARPRVARLKSTARLVRGRRGGGAVLRGAAGRPHRRRDAVVGPAADRRRLGRGLRGARPRHAAQRGARAGLGRAARDPDRPGGRTTTSPPTSSGRCCDQDRDLLATFDRAWPLLEATDVVGDLWSVPAYLRRCAPWLSARRGAGAAAAGRRTAWTLSDLPLAGRGAAAAGRSGGGAAQAPAGRRRPPRERERMAGVIDELIEADDSELLLMTIAARTATCATPWSTSPHCPRADRTCSPARSRTSWWTRRRS